jgi:hypothetical protein
LLLSSWELGLFGWATAGSRGSLSKGADAEWRSICGAVPPVLTLAFALVLTMVGNGRREEAVLRTVI